MSMIDGIAASTATSVNSPQTRVPKQDMDGELFLQLLVAQLRAQDPSSPLDTNAMIAQTAQLSTVEQLTNISSQNEVSFGLQLRTAATQLLGREVTYPDADGNPKTGTAVGISFEGAVPMITVGDEKVRFDAVVSVAPPASSESPAA